MHGKSHNESLARLSLLFAAGLSISGVFGKDVAERSVGLSQPFAAQPI